MSVGQPAIPAWQGPLFVILGAALWGTTGTSQALAPEGSHPALIGAMRLGVGALCMLIMAALSGGLRAGFSRREWRIVLWGGLMVATYQLCFFAAVLRTGVAVGTVVGIGSAPLFGGLLGRLFRAERLGVRWGLATAVALAGCGLLGLGGTDQVRVDGLGLLLAVGAGLSFALYTLSAKSLLGRHAPDMVMAGIFSCGALCMLPFFVVLDTSWIWTARGLAVSLYLGLLATALAYWFFARGLHTTDVGLAVSLSLTEPLTAALLGVLLLGEGINMQVGLGMVLILAGILILGFPVRRRRLCSPPSGAGSGDRG